MKNLKHNYLAWEEAYKNQNDILWKDFFLAYHFIRKRLWAYSFLIVFSLKGFGHILHLLFLSDPRKVRIIDEYQGIYEEI